MGAKDGIHPRSGFATQDTIGTNGGTIKRVAFADPRGDTYLIYIDRNYDELTPWWIAYSDLSYQKDSQLNACVEGGAFAECYGKQGKNWEWNV